MNSSGWNHNTTTDRKWKLDINSDGTTTIDTYQDVEPIIERNKLNLNNFGDKLTFGKLADEHIAASIPFNVWEKWCKETDNEITKDPKLLAKYLNDPDNKYFRTTPTRI